MSSSIPIIDVAPLAAFTPGRAAVAAQLGDACREHGFFYVVGHGVDEALQARLLELASTFFAQPLEVKRRIALAVGGRAWRGYFGVGEELTSGKPDEKEGLYFGAELPATHPLVVAGTPLHGANLFGELPGLRETVLEYMDAMTRLGHTLVGGLALALGLDAHALDAITRDPLTLFRIFNYPPSSSAERWGVAEHTDYGLLTMLLQDESGGLEVWSKARWLEAPPVRGSFVCNIGDMLDRMTQGRFRSTPHRVRNTRSHDRLSFPFFFDPSFNARVQPLDLPGDPPLDDREHRWDHASVHAFDGTYGDYLLAKVGRVFPSLKRAVL